MQLTTSRHQNANGQAENAIGTIKQSIRTNQPHRWEELLHVLQYAHNTTPHTSTKVSPCQQVFGDDMLVQDDRKTIQPWATLLLNARIALAKAQKDQAHAYNQRHRQQTFAIGDQVMLSRDGIAAPHNVVVDKYQPFWLGPFTVAECDITKDNYKLDLPYHLALHPVFHTSKLKPYVASTKTASRPTANTEGEYEVADILLHRTRRKKIEYLIMWRGYDLADATWEPETNITNAPDILLPYKMREGLLL